MKYQCPHCDAKISEDTVMSGNCSECRKVVDISSVQKAEEPLAEPEEKGTMPYSDGNEGKGNVKRSVVVGILTGIMVFLFYTIFDFFFFRRASFTGWLNAILGIIIMGTLMGAVVGLVVEKTRNKSYGILSGAGLLALVHMFLLTGPGVSPGFKIAGLFSGAFYGAILGWAITSSVIEHIKREENVE